MTIAKLQKTENLSLVQYFYVILYNRAITHYSVFVTLSIQNYSKTVWNELKKWMNAK